MLSRILFDLQYRLTKPRWDTGVTPPELVALVEAGTSGKRALDLGCGTGTNAIYLAEHGFEVVGVDFSSRAIATAKAKARQRGLRIEFHVSDVTALDSIKGPFDLVFDVGCFHSLDESGRARYVANLQRLTRRGGIYLLYAFGPREDDGMRPGLRVRRVGISPAAVKQVMGVEFELQRMEQGNDHGSRTSAWYWFKRIQGGGDEVSQSLDKNIKRV